MRASEGPSCPPGRQKKARDGHSSPPSSVESSLCRLPPLRPASLRVLLLRRRRGGKRLQIEHKGHHQLSQVCHRPGAIGGFVPIVEPVGMSDDVFRGEPSTANGLAFRTPAAFAVPLGALMRLRRDAELPAGRRGGLLGRGQTLVPQGAVGTVP